MPELVLAYWSLVRKSFAYWILACSVTSQRFDDIIITSTLKAERFFNQAMPGTVVNLSTSSSYLTLLSPDRIEGFCTVCRVL